MGVRVNLTVVEDIDPGNNDPLRVRFEVGF